MIRRIVDSVSLLIDTESQHNQDCSGDSPTNPEFDSTDYNFFGSHAVQLTVDSNTESNRISCSLPFLSRCSSIPSSPVTLPPNESAIGCELFGSYSQTGILSNAVSCYVAPKEKAKRNFPQSSLHEAHYNILHHSVSDADHLERHSSSSPSPVRHHVRRQSLSPKCSLNLNSFKRQLPGGPVLQPQRPQPQNRAHRPHLTQVSSAVVRKKETTEQFDRPHPRPATEQMTTSAAVDDESDLKDVGVEGTASQADPLIMSVECLLLPFIRSLNEVELRIPANRLNKVQRRILKRLAAENELLILSASSVVVLKGLFEQPTIVVRKRAALIQRQQTELECRQREAEAHAQRLAAEKAEALLKPFCEVGGNRNLPTHQDTCCQANVEDSKPETGLGRKKYRRLRNERRRQAKAALTQTSKKTKRVDSCMQTVPEDHLLCLWCLQHIPPEAQCGHEAICRAGVKQKEKERELKIRLAQRKADVETRRRQRLGLQPLIKDKRKPQGVPAAVVPIDSISGRSRSHTRLAIREKLKKKSLSRHRSASRSESHLKSTVVAKLDQLHPNDLSAMVHLMKRVCAEPQCKQLAIITGDQSTRPGGSNVKCADCRRSYCDRHRPVGMHTGCKADTAFNSEMPETCCTSIACGLDLEEKRAQLKSAMKQRREMLRERRQRC